MPFDPAAPVVDVAAAAALNPLTGGDLDPTIDVQITPEIISKAAQLGTPKAMYEFVRNECEFQPYYGSRKGSVETLRQRAGNDYDLASLLLALLRASGYPARYAEGIVEMPVGRATKWLGVDSGSVAGSILYTHGMEGVSIVDGGGAVIAVRARRIWVEAYLPRGFGSPTWVPLDPSFSMHSIHPGLDIPEEMLLDAQKFIDDYWDPPNTSVVLPRPEKPIELLAQEVTTYVNANHPGLTLSDVMRSREKVPETLGVLPSSLPYTVRTRDGFFLEIPAARRYRIRFNLYDGATTLIDSTSNLPEIAGRRVTIDYLGATPADQAIIDSNGGIYRTPPWQVDLKPVLRVDGVVVATGAAGVGMGLSHASDIYFLAPVNATGLPQNVVPSIFNTIITGAAQAIGFSIDGVSEGLLNPPPADDTEGLASLLNDTALDYLAEARNSDLSLGRLMHDFVTTDVADAIVENVVKVTYSAGVPQTFEWVGLRVDADRSVLGVWPVGRMDPPGAEPKDFLIISGAEGSLLESRIYEDSYGQNAVSTIKLLELATDTGITVYKRWNTLPLPANTQSSSVRNALQNAILSGHVVTFPASPMTIGLPGTGQWTGTAWIDMDPADGGAGYIISGGNNGGATVEIWPPAFIDLSSGNRRVRQVQIEIVTPVADSPAVDAIFTRDNEQSLTFEYRVHVTYDDASTATLPAGGGTYKRVTRNTTRTLVPGNYTFKVWIARQIFWIFNVTIAEAQRQVSIVGVLIRENDQTMFGGTPPKLLSVKPPAPATAPTVPIMALVIPERAPDGTVLASAYAWSGGAKLNFVTPAMKNTSTEAAGSDPSAAENDQLVDVVTTLPGGKTQRGYAKLNYAAGGSDEQHKMTVFSLEIDKCLAAFRPQGGSQDNTVDIVSRIRPNAVKGQFIFTLSDVSEEDGYCLNAPMSLPLLPWSEDGVWFRDFQFQDQTGFDIDGILWNYRATTTATNLSDATVRVNAYDYGAFGKIKSEFKINGKTYLARETGGVKENTNLPLDDDDNHIADGWTGNAGGFLDDTDNIPATGMTSGDGLSRYEEWRGFLVNTAHLRTDPARKDVFIHDEDGIGLGSFGALNVDTRLITADEFNGTGSREVNFRRESHNVVLQHGLWLRDTDLGPMGSWGDAEAVGSPGAGRVHINVDLAQVVTDMTNAPPVGFRPPGAANRTAVAQAQLIPHELGHGVAVFHHGVGYVGAHSGDNSCVMRYYFTDMQTAAALPPPQDVAAFNAVPIGTTFCNTAPVVCRSDVDISDK